MVQMSTCRKWTEEEVDTVRSLTTGTRCASSAAKWGIIQGIAHDHMTGSGGGADTVPRPGVVIILDTTKEAGPKRKKSRGGDTEVDGRKVSSCMKIQGTEVPEEVLN